MENLLRLDSGGEFRWDRKVWITEYAPTDIFPLTSGLFGQKKMAYSILSRKDGNHCMKWTY